MFDYMCIAFAMTDFECSRNYARTIFPMINHSEIISTLDFCVEVMAYRLFDPDFDFESNNYKRFLNTVMEINDNHNDNNDNE